VSSLHREGYRIDKKQLLGNLEKALAKQNPWSVL
jgi:hypothetical protein